MPHSRTVALSVSSLTLLGGMVTAAPGGYPPAPAPNESGVALTFTQRKKLDPNNPYFAQLGTNNRSCNTCHREDSGWSITPGEVQARFDATLGLEALFRTNDGSNSPVADVSSVEARRAAYSLLRTRGLIRVGLPLPASAEFTLDAVDDPHNHASAAELSLYRRPLPATNLKFQPTLMWDGRETTEGNTQAQNLAHQASGATTGHAQATAEPDAATLAQIVGFESALFNAQVSDAQAGSLDRGGVRGGPRFLAKQKFKLGINNPFPAPGQKPFNPDVFKLFQKWAKARAAASPEQLAARQSIARGERSFNEKRFAVSGVAGLNDEQGKPVITVTCSTCHNTPNVGSSSVGALQDIGVSDPSRRLPDVPLYTLCHLKSGEIRQTTDPGRALITGKWKDIDRFKVPALRGLSARPPYFHDGSAATLQDVVDFYDERFHIGYPQQEKRDLVAFLRSL